MKQQLNEPCFTRSQMNLIFNMRIFWRRLAIWSRIYITSRYLGIGTAEVAFERLYIENLDFGDTLHIPFTRSIAARFSQLINRFSIGLRELITAQIEQDFDGIRLSIDRLLENANETAAFLASVNPYIDEEEWRNLFTEYLQNTMQEANLFAAEDYRMDIEYFDRLMELSNTMGDAFAQALYRYITSGAEIPDNLSSQNGQLCLTSEQMNLLYDIRMFWFDLVIWTRALMLSQYMNVGDQEEVYERLQTVVTDHIANLTQIFGENAAVNALHANLITYIDLMNSLIAAQIAGDVNEIDRLVRLLYENADDIAASRAAINPYWDEDAARTRLYNNLRYTIDESTMFLTQDYGMNLYIFSALMDQAENFSDNFTEGLLEYILQN